MTPILGPGEPLVVLPREAIELAQTALTASFRACDEAGAVLKKHYGRLKSVDEKFQAGLVSEADRESEDTIKSLIHGQFPDHQILGEETGLSSGSGGAWKALWMIDPLDGTTNYVHRVPFFCISMGLEVEIDGRRELLAGVVDAPLMNWRYHAIRGQGAFLNGNSIAVSNRTEFREGLFATGFSNSDNTLDQQMELLLEVIRKARGIRRLGAAALDLCMVAEGVFDGFWERNLQPWDTAAGVLIAREAGAVATDFSGRPFVPTYKSVLCAPPAQHEHVLQHMKRVSRR
ncbi:MAG: inositol monophosphatase [Bdellovibrionales bacterium]|nr:inositol monophosphatase [Bdellovibrionales bacterium]